MTDEAIRAPLGASRETPLGISREAPLGASHETPLGRRSRETPLGASREASAGARELSAVGSDLAAQRIRAGAAIAAASAGLPWGDDAGGQAFDQRYRTVERQVLDAWEQLADYIESLGEAAARAVHDVSMSGDRQ